MENSTLLNDQILAAELLKITALQYLKEALVNQQFESCRDLIDTAKSVGVEQAEITAAIAQYLNIAGPGRAASNRIR